MLNRVKDQWTRRVWGERFTALHLHLLDSEKFAVSALHMERKGDNLEILDKLEPTDSLEHVASFVGGENPMTLVITGKGIISKRLARNVGGETEQVKEHLGEYGNTEVVNSVTLNENWLYLNVMRTDLMRSWLDRLRHSGIQPLKVDLGPSTAWELLQYASGHGVVNSGFYHFEYNISGISVIEESDGGSDSFVLDDERFDSRFILPYAGVISFLKQTTDKQDSDAILSTEFEEAYYRNATKLTGILSVAVLFLVLSVNAVLFMHYHDLQGKLEAQLFEHQGKISELELLKGELKQKQEMSAFSGSSTHGRFAFHADRIVSVMVKGIRLTRLVVNPMQPKEPRSNRITVKADVIEVEGTCKESNVLDEWITSLVALEEVGSVRILDFGKKRDSEENEFALEVKMKI